MCGIAGELSWTARADMGAVAAMVSGIAGMLKEFKAKSTRTNGDCG